MYKHILSLVIKYIDMQRLKSKCIICWL